MAILIRNDDVALIRRGRALVPLRTDELFALAERLVRAGFRQAMLAEAATTFDERPEIRCEDTRR